MITRLRIERFGALAGRELGFGAVTLFVGPNESGKTTIVDALCEALCKPRSNRTAGKRLALRYGTERQVTADFDGDPVTIPEDAFYDLYAIRSGDLTIDVKPGASWVEALKAELFTAGLDPKRLHAALARRASTDGGSRHNRELRRLQEERSGLEERRDGLRQRAAASRAAESAADGLRAERDRLAAGLHGVTGALEERQRRSRRRLQQAERREAERLLQRFEELDRDPADAAATAQAAARLQELADAADAAATEVAAARAGLEQARGRLRAPDAGRPARPAPPDGPDLPDGPNSPDGRALPDAGRSAISMAGVALGLLAGGALAAVLLVAETPVLLAAAAGVAAAGAAMSAAVLIRQRNAGFAAAQAEIDHAAELLRSRREQHEHAERELRGFLERHEAESKEQLLLRLGGAQVEEERRREVEAELAAAARERGLPGPDALRDALRGRLRDLPHDPPAAPAQPAAPAAVERDGPDGPAADADAAGEEERLRSRAAELRERLERLDERIARDRQQAAALGAGADEMADLDARASAAERRIAALELDRRAAGVAAELFARIAGETTAALDELSAGIGAAYTALSGSAAGPGGVYAAGTGAPSPAGAPTPAGGPGPSSSVHLQALEEQPLVVDAYGAARPADRLSHGTRDAYALAARLALAERTRREPALLIMDEPFRAIDTTRMRRALRLVARFRERTGWQVVFLTADERAAQAVRAQFSDALVHRLSIEPAGAPPVT